MRIGENPVETRGGIFPEADLTLGATTINKIIGSFDSFGGFNLGKVILKWANVLLRSNSA